jgi:hypothetical protein
MYILDITSKIISKGETIAIVFGYKKKMASYETEIQNCKPEKSVGSRTGSFIQKFSDTKLMRKEIEIHADRPVPSPSSQGSHFDFVRRFIKLSHLPYLTQLWILFY